MVVNKLLSLKECQVNLIKSNEPGIYFLFNEDKELIYIGESKFPLCRVLDHYNRSYHKDIVTKLGKVVVHTEKGKKKGIGPIFSYMRIMSTNSKDARIRQHYEKRWIRKYNPPLNFNTKNENYDLNWKEINSFILVYENFFKKNKTWYRYLNDEVMNKRPGFMKHKAMKRKIRWITRGV